MKQLFVSVPMKGRTEEEIKASIQKIKKLLKYTRARNQSLSTATLRTTHRKTAKKQYGIQVKALRSWRGLMCSLELWRTMIGVAVALKGKQQKGMALKHI